nr:MAG TPA: hypothetical protein [Microviridae sp.]
MLSMINLLKDYTNDKKKLLFLLRQLKKEDLYDMYKKIDKYEKEMLYKHLSKETLITVIDLALHRLTFNKNVLDVAPELKYKGKYPEKYKKNISKIAEQLDNNGNY